ncbi:unnamed protein product [Caretta caretta]
MLRVPDPSPAEPLRGPDRAARARRAGPGEAAGARRARREEPLAGLCEIHVLPLVVAAQDPRRPQRLHCSCRGSARAPSRSLPVVSPGPAAAPCELDENTRRCHRQQLPSHKSCRMYQTCHHAVLISGGWQEQITCPHHARNLRLFGKSTSRPSSRATARRQGLPGALAASAGPDAGSQCDATRGGAGGRDPVDWAQIDQLLQRAPAFSLPHSALDWEERGRGGGRRLAEKRQIRSHLALGCRGQLCTDSLALYLNSSGRRDGTMLLWASKENGSGPGAALREPGPPGSPGGGRPQGALPCGRAPGGPGGLQRPQRRYPGPLARQLLASGQHGNMVLLSGQLGSDVARGSAFSEFWARPQPDQCLLQDLGQAGPRAAGSSPGATLQLLNVTLAGAPCHSTPPRMEDKHRRVFLGCQNLPTRLCCQATHTPQQDDA